LGFNYIIFLGHDNYHYASDLHILTNHFYWPFFLFLVFDYSPINHYIYNHFYISWFQNLIFYYWFIVLYRIIHYCWWICFDDDFMVAIIEFMMILFILKHYYELILYHNGVLIIEKYLSVLYHFKIIWLLIMIIIILSYLYPHIFLLLSILSFHNQIFYDFYYRYSFTD